MNCYTSLRGKAVAICCGTVIAKEVRLWQSAAVISDLDSSVYAVAHLFYAGFPRSRE